METNRLVEGQRVFDVEIEALRRTRDCLGDAFLNILDSIVNCEGKVIVTGMGKPSHIAAKMASTFASLGTPAFFLHPAEAMHGDLGMISEKDIVLMISYSGESDEIIRILSNIKMIGAKIIGITGNASSTLAKASDMLQVLPKFDEACNLGLAPTSSTTSVLCYGDALAIVASELYGFKDVDFGKFHPAGALGKRLLLRVEDLMACGEQNAIIEESASLKEAIVELSKKGKGLVSIVDNNNKLIGVITDGDLRRQLEKGVDIYSLNAIDIMSRNPKHISGGKLAVEALQMLKEYNIAGMPVVNDLIVVGVIRVQDIIGAGIVG